MIEAVGIWFYSLKTDRYLFLMRNDSRNPNTWGLPGGKREEGETLYQTLHRECSEELGYFPEYIKLVPVEQFTSPDNKFCYHTFFCLVQDEFVPTLNQEHHGYSWITSGIWPKPLHPGLWNTVNIEDVMNKINVVQQNF